MMRKTQPHPSTVHVDRKQLLAALQRIGGVVPNRPYKPILQGVRLEASGGQLRLHATDLETTLSTTVEAGGMIPPAVARYTNLAQRIKTGKGDVCTLQLDLPGNALIINGGAVEHRVGLLELQEYPITRASLKAMQRFWFAGRPQPSDTETARHAAQGTRHFAEWTAYQERLRQASVDDAYHRPEILASEACGCYWCLAVFPPTEIVKWEDCDASGDGQTALCPYCGKSGVLGSALGYAITREFLADVRRPFLGRPDDDCAATLFRHLSAMGDDDKARDDDG